MAAIHATSFPVPECWSADAFARHLALPGVFGLLDAVGAMVLARVAADEAEILTLAVAPPARRAGRATALLRAAEQCAAAAGAHAMYLEVATDNRPGRALYEAAGYREVGARRGYYGDGTDALVLTRVLSRDVATAE